MNGYSLTKNWFNFRSENSPRAKSIHSELYLYIVDLWNRLGQKETFGLPTSVTMEMLGIGSYNTYKKAFNDLVEFGFIEVVSLATNQHQSRVIKIVDKDTENGSKLDNEFESALSKSDTPTQSAVSNYDIATDTPTKNNASAISNNDIPNPSALSKSDVASDTIIEPVKTINKIKDYRGFLENEQNVENSDFGDGELFSQVLEYQKKNPDKYPKELYKEFLLHWTAIVQNGIKKNIGKEAWRTRETFAIAGRLAQWFKNYKPKEAQNINGNFRNGSSVPVRTIPVITPQQAAEMI